MTGQLVLVGTPIGNLEDFSPRGLAALRAADRILAEDTRHSAKLLRHFGVSTPMSAWHAHNENEPRQLDAVLRALQQGQQLALISDAGMPLIADPGYGLVRAVREAGFAVDCVPGPTALTTALVLSGLPAERFVFEGFLPAKSAARQARLGELRTETRTLLLYESPHRLQASLSDMLSVLGAQRQACVARELTKRFQTVVDGSLEELVAWSQDPEQVTRGEFVIAVHGAPAAAAPSALDAEALMRELLRELPARKAAKITARLCGGSANTYYQASLADKA